MWLLAPFLGMQRRYVARNVGHPLRLDLGLRYRSAAETLNDQIQQLLRDRLLAGTA